MPAVAQLILTYFFDPYSTKIYCIGLFGPRFHKVQAWTPNIVPTIGAVYGKNLSISEYDG